MFTFYHLNSEGFLFIRINKLNLSLNRLSKDHDDDDDDDLSNKI